MDYRQFQMFKKMVLLICLSIAAIIVSIHAFCSSSKVMPNECIVDSVIEVPQDIQNEMGNELTEDNEYKISKNGIQFIKQFETCKLKAYHISGEKYNTIGWGHLLDEKYERNVKNISQYKADKLFEEDIKWVNDACNRLLNNVNKNYKFNQGIVDGMCSLIYNCGEDGVKNTEFYQRLQNCRFSNNEINQKDLEYTLAAVKTTKVSKPGLVKRRQAEYDMMRS